MGIRSGYIQMVYRRYSGGRNCISRRVRMGKGPSEMSIFLKQHPIKVLVFALCGISIGMITVFAMDILFASGKFLARDMLTSTPKCLEGCHTYFHRHDKP